MQHSDILAIAGLRIDGRRNVDVRLIKLKIGVASSADGSCYFEQGLNKVLVLIHGPVELQRRADDSNEKGSLKCRLINAPFSGSDRRKRRVGDRKTVEMELSIRQTFESVVMLESYPRSEINVVIHVLESDGSLICAIMNAVCVALMDAGIMTTDMITSCSAGVLKQNVCQDLNETEQNSSGAYLPIAVKSASEEIVYLQLDSRLSLELLDEAMKEALKGCKKLRNIIQEAIKENMIIAKEKNKSSGL